MSENWLQKMPTFDDWIVKSSSILNNANFSSSRLDAELILAHTIRKPRTYLHTHGDETLDERRQNIADARLELRLNHTPVAYIVGHKEFYGRRFTTTPAALIPRPETETMIEMLKEIIPQNLSLIPNPLHAVDVGTGTGCIGITVKKEWPELEVTLTDISNHALNLAKDNASRLVADVHFIKSDLLHGYVLPIDILLANLPYVDKEWEVSSDTQAEPKEAIFADDDGLALIYQLIYQAQALVNTGGHLLLESDPRQHAAINAYAKKHGFTHLKTTDYISAFTKTN